MTDRRPLFDTCRTALRTLIRRSGFKVARLPEHHSHQYWIQEVIRAEDINLLIDVGACVGDFVAEIRSLGYHGRTLLVEPSTANHERLSVRFSPESGTTVRQLALGSGTRTIEMMTYPARPDLNSTRGFSADGRAYFENPLPLIERVSMRRLDDLMRDEGLESPSNRIFLKVDTQGSDW